MRFVFGRRALAAAALLAGVVSIASCGGRSSPAVQSGNVVIFEQPVSVAVPIGRAATFTAAAETTPSQVPVYPVAYQWSKNGVAIPGATASSYTTPTITLADNRTQYMVTASSGSNSVNSAVATLTAGARAPAIGDVRYLLLQQVTASGWPTAGGVGVFADEPEEDFNALGTPLPVGKPGCGWQYSYNFLPASMDGRFDMYYQEGGNLPWSSYLNSLDAGNIVISSMDLEPACQDGIVVAYVGVQAAGFDYQLDEVPSSQVGATIANYGSESRIVTAVTYDSSANEWVLISYGWQGDRTTLYNSQAVFIPGGTDAQLSTQTASEAQTLASQGYFISAFGGDPTDGYLMVGMQVQGDTLPRPIMVDTSTVPANADNAYWTPVVWQYPVSVTRK